MVLAPSISSAGRRLVAALFALVTLPAIAGMGIKVASTQVADYETVKATDPLSTAIRHVAFNRQLIEDGIRAKDPLAMLTALRVLGEVRFPDTPRKVSVVGDHVPEASLSIVGSNVAIETTRQLLIAKAREFSQGRADLAALIEDSSTTRSRGAGGQIYAGNIGPRSVSRFNITFEQGRPAIAYLDGNDPVDLDLHVMDTHGRRICADTRPDSIGLCEWTAGQDGMVTVTVVNLGNTSSSFVLLTN